jgi:hypothetical protein
VRLAAMAMGILSGAAHAGDLLIEAEAATRTPPMILGQDGAASDGGFVYTPTERAGSAAFHFEVSRAGPYVIDARVRTLHDIEPGYCDGGNACDSFFVGMDGERAARDEYYGFHLQNSVTFYWETVTRTGTCSGTCFELDPMIWQLDAGSHTVTFYGREAYAELDAIRIRSLEAPTARDYAVACGCNPGPGPIETLALALCLVTRRRHAE